MKKIEILAPAGSYESFVAAINAGADAVYTGGMHFGARANAVNLEEDQLLKAMEYAHLHNKNVYLTVNTLLKDREVRGQLYEYIQNVYIHGLDAVIVQDLGVMDFIHEHFPDLPIHASTQMSINMEEAANLLKDYGVTRVVNSRELSLKEIQEFRNNTHMEIESFVHGALCYCYSGQCLMSSMLGDRSGNRGRCAQPCRKPYQLRKNEAIISQGNQPYLLSPKDICTLDLIPDLIQAGIDSFKIEGRMKGPEYTALTTSMYRKYVDLYLSLGREKYERYLASHRNQWHQDIQNLMDLYNREEFTTGYYNQYNGKNMMAFRRPNHHGVRVGVVTGVKGDVATIQLVNEIHSQDVLEFRNDKYQVLYEYTVKNPGKPKETITAKFKHQSKIKMGDQLYRTRNNALLTKIREKYLQHEKKILITGEFTAKVGKPSVLRLKMGAIQTSIQGDMVEEAQNQPVTEEKIREKLLKTNDTLFSFEDLQINMEGRVFLPIGKINEIRRLGLLKLREEFLESKKRTLSIEQKKEVLNKRKFHEKTGIHVVVKNKIQALVALEFTEVSCLSLSLDGFLGMEIDEIVKKAQRNNTDVYLIFPPVIRRDTFQKLLDEFHDITHLTYWSIVKGFIIKNLESYAFVKKYWETEDKDMILDYNMYIMNDQAKRFWDKLGIRHFTAPVELNDNELKNLGCEDMDVIVYGHLPFMTSAQCVVKNTIGCTDKSDVYTLMDGKEMEFLCLNQCKYCYNIIYSGQPISLINHLEEVKRLDCENIRLDFTIESKESMYHLLRGYIQSFCYGKKIAMEQKLYTKGHFKRGIK